MMENHKCDQCGIEIKDSQATVERDGKTYCSEACANQGSQRAQTPSKTPIV
jgi:hypothetical protein